MRDKIIKKTPLFCVLLALVLSFTCSKIIDPELPDEITLFTPQKQYATAVGLVWSRVTSDNFAAYIVYYDTLPEVSDSSIFAMSTVYKNDTSYTLSGLMENTTYYVKVFAYNSSAHRESNEIEFSTLPCTCGVFVDLKQDGMVLIPAGCFIGKDSSVAVLTRGYFMDTTEVTEAEWNRVMSGLDVDTSEFTQKEWDGILGRDTSTSVKPKTYITWNQMVLFCNAKSKQNGVDTCYTYTSIFIDTVIMRIEYFVELQCHFIFNGFRLPTEDEWEYAYRAGGWEEYYWNRDGQTVPDYPFKTTYPVSEGDKMEVSEYAWWSYNNTPIGPKKVALKKSNAWHLYDMAGNVNEFVWNLWSPQLERIRTDYRGPLTGPQSSTLRIVRGGSFDNAGKKPVLTAWWRNEMDFPSLGSDVNGFRTVRTF